MLKKTRTKIADMQAAVEQHLNQIHEHFIPEVRLTFIARLPGNNEADVLITIDNLDELSRLIDRFKRRETKNEVPSHQTP